jgi:lipopolysaccharide/colanic/teichoic acid biosynthesis glycosyltransferase
MKRLVDILGAALGLVLLAPLLLVLSLLIWCTMGCPVLFRQVRPGRHSKPFQMVKFRTMRNAVGADGRPLPDAERLTRLGRLLRLTSLDEVPELWNVLKGDMSLVGPRPLLMEYLAYYTDEEMVRHTVRPGITGLAQVSGRNMATWNDRLALDVTYVKRRTMWMDLKIMLLTLVQIIKRDGVVVVPSSTLRKLSDERARH